VVPAGILEMAGGRIGENPEGDRPKAGEAGKGLFFLGSRRPPFLLDDFQGANSGDDVAGFGLLALGDSSYRQQRLL